MQRLATFSLLLGLCVQSAWSQTRVMPVDQAVKVPEFFAFRSQLQNAVARHDAQAVLAAVHPEVDMGFGGEHGLKDFKAKWKLSDPDSPLWDVLSTILSQGGSFNKDGSFTAPYVASNWPQRYRGVGYVAAVGPAVEVKSAPQTQASTWGVLNFQVVELADLDEDLVPQGWRAVQWKNGKTAYVESRNLRGPSDYRLGLSKHSGRWQISSLVAG